jgi:hypothetical protein
MIKLHNDKINIEESIQAQALRNKAEAKIAHKKTQLTDQSFSKLSSAEVKALIQELQVHQIELEMQNKSLRTTQLELDRERSRYFDLYNLAPVGYITISAGGACVRSQFNGSNHAWCNTHGSDHAANDTIYLYR